MSVRESYVGQTARREVQDAREAAREALLTYAEALRYWQRRTSEVVAAELQRLADEVIRDD